MDSGYPATAIDLKRNLKGKYIKQQNQIPSTAEPTSETNKTIKTTKETRNICHNQFFLSFSTHFNLLPSNIQKTTIENLKRPS